jgi:predicted transcriptional regulator
MKKFDIPDFKYSDSETKETVSMRLPKTLWKEVSKISKRKGWDKTMLVTLALDQYCQWENRKK